MLAPRPIKLRSQRDINLWRIPLQLSLAAVALFAITLIPDILDKYGVIHIPSWLTMGSIDDARAILSAMTGAVHLFARSGSEYANANYFSVASVCRLNLQ
jgi:hypothetical protein